MSNERENPTMDFIVPALGIICLIALAIQTWFFIDWLMSGTETWMKYVTLCFFDIFGGIWLIFRLFHTPPNQGTYHMVRAGIIVDFLLSASTTVAWCFIFITRTPLTPSTIANMVDTCRWLVAFAVIFNSFLTIFYAVATAEYRTQKGRPKKKWATERVASVSPPQTTVTPVSLAQTAQLPEKTITLTQAQLDELIAKAKQDPQ